MPDKVNSIIEDSELKTIGNQELIALLRKIQGNRSLREYSRAAGISPAALPAERPLASSHRRKQTRKVKLRWRN